MTKKRGKYDKIIPGRLDPLGQTGLCEKQNRKTRLSQKEQDAIDGLRLILKNHIRKMAKITFG